MLVHQLVRTDFIVAGMQRSLSSLSLSMNKYWALRPSSQTFVHKKAATDTAIQKMHVTNVCKHFTAITSKLNSRAGEEKAFNLISSKDKKANNERIIEAATPH